MLNDTSTVSAVPTTRISKPDYDVFSTPLAYTIHRDKYSMNGTETWRETAHRVVEAVCSGLISSTEMNAIEDLVVSRKFIPAGRYLYAAGRPLQNFNNCFLMRVEDTREDWAGLANRVMMGLMTGGGVGVDYSALRPKGTPVKRTGGVASGPISLMYAINEIGRQVMQGASRRSAIFASLAWNHADIFEFLNIKNHPQALRDMKLNDLTFPLPMELTNVSVIYDKSFFDAHDAGDDHARRVWSRNCLQAFKTAEPGMSFNYKNARESLRNAPVSASTQVLTKHGYVRIGNIVNEEIEVWTGFQWVKTTFRKTKSQVPTVIVVMSNGRSITADPEHEFFVLSNKLNPRVPAGNLEVGQVLWTHGEGRPVTVTSVTPGPIEDVFCCDVGVEEHSFCAEGVIISNCTEVVSEDDSDKCNLGTLWMSKFRDKDEFASAVDLATLFLLCGGIRSDTPTKKVREIGNRNNRIGLGLGGMHEWLMRHRSDYEVTPTMHEWLVVYRDVSDASARRYADRLEVAEPKGKRALAPNGTIGIIAETTTGIEPLFCAAYKRRYFKNDQWHYQYVVDGSVKRLLSDGVPLELIERNDAYALGFEQRIKFQADVQDYVDMSISSTCNMAPWGSKSNNEDNVQEKADILYKYAPRLRGFTCYPDGCRGGQPLTKVSVEQAMSEEGSVYIEEVRDCVNGVCGL